MEELEPAEKKQIIRRFLGYRRKDGVFVFHTSFVQNRLSIARRMGGITTNGAYPHQVAIFKNVYETCKARKNPRDHITWAQIKVPFLKKSN